MEFSLLIVIDTLQRKMAKKVDRFGRKQNKLRVKRSSTIKQCTFNCMERYRRSKP